MKKFLLAAVAALLSTAAVAADLPGVITKAPPLPSPYAFATGGPFFGLYTEGGGGPVTASVPGVAPASLTTTTAAIGVTVGWSHKFSNGLLGTIEADACAKNFNGANAGFSAAGPVCLAQRVMVFAPTDQVLNLLTFANVPNIFGSLANIVAPPGSTVKNSWLGVGFEAYWNDMTIAYQGVGANKVWAVNPALVLMKQDLISNSSGSVAFLGRTFLKVDFESQTVLFGAHQATEQKGVGARIGVGADF